MIYKVGLFSVCMLLSGCTSILTEQEKSVTGSWRHEIGTTMNPDSTFGYLELSDNRMGRTGVVVNMHGELRHYPQLSFTVTNWKISHDTLIVDYMMKGGLFSSPGQKDTVLNDFAVTDRWIIKSISESEFIGEVYDPSIPFETTTTFVRTDKIEYKE